VKTTPNLSHIATLSWKGGVGLLSSLPTLTAVKEQLKKTGYLLREGTQVSLQGRETELKER